MKLRFTKMQGTGNDFVVLDAIRQTVQLTRAQIQQLADRHFGVGCDQVLLVERPQTDGVDFRYRIFNADGTEVEQCGNGARCFARFVWEHKLTEKRELVVETLRSKIQLQILDEDSIRVDLGIPRWAPADVPLVMDQEKLEYDLEISGQAIALGIVSMGNPHAVITVPTASDAPVNAYGSILNADLRFPMGVNVGFMERVDLHQINLRVYERGVGETLACGSGACAAVVHGIRSGLLASPVQVLMPGGAVTIEWLGPGNSVKMVGPATIVFQGEWEIPS